MLCLVPGVCEQHPQEEGQRFHGGYQDQDQAHGKILGRQRNYIKKSVRKRGVNTHPEDEIGKI